MAQVKNVVEGMEILAKTAEVPCGLAEKGETDTRTAHIRGAEHDVLFGPESDPSEGDISRLEELGWFYDSEVECWAIFC